MPSILVNISLFTECTIKLVFLDISIRSFNQGIVKDRTRALPGMRRPLL